MRGEHLGCPLWAVHLSRITPACAGSTWEVVYQNEDYGDHPRMRGEHLMATANGKNDDLITPACAGSTSEPVSKLRRIRDHPRMRGEHFSHPFLSPKFEGSPPHARGALLPDFVSFNFPRITPACAGSTFVWSYVLGYVSDHPRMRGEHGLVPAQNYSSK